MGMRIVLMGMGMQLEWEWVGMGMGMVRWEWEGNGNKKVIPAHLYPEYAQVMKSTYHEIQDGGPPKRFKSLNRCNSAADCLISRNLMAMSEF